jgi:hypothetical protein
MDGMAHTLRRIPTTAAARRTSANAWLPEAPSADQFRALALVAMDAAKQAGADFADIRIGVQRTCTGGSAQLSLGYGIRARVNGTWSFEHGTVLTTDAVATLARSAVVGARTASSINAQLGRRVVEPFAAVPVVTGEWHSPVEIDPFTVPIDDFVRVIGNFNEPAKRYGFSQAYGGLSWIAETRVFASTEGSLVTQSTMRGGPQLAVRTWRPTVEDVQFDVLRPDGESVGFEVMLKTNYYDRVIEKLEEAIRWCELPFKPFRGRGALSRGLRWHRVRWHRGEHAQFRVGRRSVVGERSGCVGAQLPAAVLGPSHAAATGVRVGAHHYVEPRGAVEHGGAVGRRRGGADTDDARRSGDGDRLPHDARERPVVRIVV